MKNYFASEPAGTWAEVYYIVSRKHHVAVVLHDNHRISHITKFFQGINKPYIIAFVKAYARFIEYVQNINKA